MTNEQHLTIEGTYEQIVTCHHFYLKWRHGALAGYFVIIGVLVAAVGWLREHHLAELLWLVCAAASVFSLLAWALEYRTRVIYRQCERVAKACELSLPSPKLRLYHEFDTRRDQWWLTRLRTALVGHSSVIDLLFWSGGAWMGGLAYNLRGADPESVWQLIFEATIDWKIEVAWGIGVALILANRLCGYYKWNCWKWIGGKVAADN
jgi:hypothetical protein